MTSNIKLRRPERGPASSCSIGEQSLLAATLSYAPQPPRPRVQNIRLRPSVKNCIQCICFAFSAPHGKNPTSASHRLILILPPKVRRGLCSCVPLNQNQGRTLSAAIASHLAVSNKTVHEMSTTRRSDMERNQRSDRVVWLVRDMTDS